MTPGCAALPLIVASMRERGGGCYAKKSLFSRSSIEEDCGFALEWVLFITLSPCSFTAFTLALQKHRTSINAQKLVDERHGPFKVHNSYQAEGRTRPNFHHLAAISSYAGQEAGNAGSYSAMRSYQMGFAMRRDEILIEIAKNA